MNDHLPSIEAATPKDSTKIAAVLRAVKLPPEAIEQHISGFLVARDGPKVVGCVALERYGTTAILRSLAVVPELRGQKLATKLAEAVIDHAKETGIQSVVLLTETAKEFFERKLGFEVVDRSVVDPVARESWQFTGAVCQSATCMKRDLH